MGVKKVKATAELELVLQASWRPPDTVSPPGESQRCLTILWLSQLGR